MAFRKVSVGGRKKKRTPAKRRTTRRRISGTGKGDIMDIVKKIGSVAAGVVGGRLLNAVIVKQMPTFTAMESGLVQIVGGGALAYFGSKNIYLSLAGYGLAGQGIAVEAVNAGLISGVGVGADRVSYRINGAQTHIGNARNLSAINGGSQTSIGNRMRRINGASELSAINGPTNLSAINGRKNKCM